MKTPRSPGTGSTLGNERTRNRNVRRDWVISLLRSLLPKLRDSLRTLRPVASSMWNLRHKTLPSGDSRDRGQESSTCPDSYRDSVPSLTLSLFLPLRHGVHRGTRSIQY